MIQPSRRPRGGCGQFGKRWATREDEYWNTADQPHRSWVTVPHLLGFELLQVFHRAGIVGIQF